LRLFCFSISVSKITNLCILKLRIAN